MTHLYTLQRVRHRYGERTVLDLDTLHIDPGEVIGLVGPSGAGKSTLLRLLALLEAPSEGQVSITLDGATLDYHSASIAQRRRVAMIFQRPVLQSRKVWANVAYPLWLRGERDVHQAVMQALERVQMLHLKDANPATLSSGEAQRVSIARALVLNPSALLLDEPTANLDPYNVRIIESFLAEQRERFGTAIVIVTHNVFQARRIADRVGLLLDGRLVEMAPTDQFFDQPTQPKTAAFLSGEYVY